jgi:hypothetical protein
MLTFEADTAVWRGGYYSRSERDGTKFLDAVADEPHTLTGHTKYAGRINDCASICVQR